MYPLQWHKNLTPEKWSGYGRGQQIVMIANELNRAGNLIPKNMIPEVKNCYERAFELVDMTTADQKWSGRSRELRRFREMLAALYQDEHPNSEKNGNLYDVLIKMNIEAYNLIG